MHALLRIPILIAAVAAAGPLAAQSPPGNEVAPPQWGTWVVGDAPAFGGETAPACTVFVFCTRRAANFDDEADYLRSLRERFGAKGLEVVAVVGEEPKDRAAAERTWQGCRIVVDDGGATTSIWLGREHVPWNVLAVDRRGVAVFLGTSQGGLVDAVERTLDGAPPFDFERQAFTKRAELWTSFDDLDGETLTRELEAIVAGAPRDGIARGLLYATKIVQVLDPGAARQVGTDAIESLREEPRALAAFADLALRCDPGGVELARALVEPLAAAAAAVPGDTFVQLARLRALVRAGADREVGRTAMRVQKLVLRSADSCLDLASILASDSDAVVHGDLVQRVLDRADELGADRRLLTASRYGLQLRCREDVEAARKVLDGYLAEVEQGWINNDCWYLMTELASMGRYTWFAAGLADRMLEQRDALQSHEFDTVALALFLAGRVGEAVELQRKSIEMGGASADYRLRLRRYEAAAASPPR